MTATRHGWLLALLLLGMPSLAWGQELPKATPEGKKALAELLRACVEAGGLKEEAAKAGQKPAWQLVDSAKLTAAFVARQEKLTPLVRDALVVAWWEGATDQEALYTALLEAFGREANDEAALGWAAFTIGYREQVSRRLEPAAAAYEKAVKHFAAAREDNYQATSLNNLGFVLEARGEYGQAQGYYAQALAVYQRLYPEAQYPAGHPSLARGLNNLGAVLQRRGESGQALGYFERALAMNQRLYPESQYPGGHPALAWSLQNLGAALRARGKYGNAQGYLEQALAMYQRLYPEAKYPGGHPDVAWSLNHLGGVLKDRGEYGPAQGYYEQGLAMYQRLYPEAKYPSGHPDLARSLNNLGAVLKARGEYGQAQNYYERSLAMRHRLYPEAKYPSGHPDLARSLQNLGAVLNAQGEYGRAQGYLEQALAMYQRLYPESTYPGGHPDLAGSLNNLGRALEVRGEYGQAQGYYEQALAMYQRLYSEAKYPDGHPELATSLNNLAGVLDSREQYGKAQAYYAQALAMRRRLYPESTYPGGHPDLAGSLNNLAAVLKNRKEYEKAQGYYEQALAMYQRLYSEAKYPGGHPDLAESLNNLGGVLNDRGEYGLAQGYYAQALAMRQRLYPESRYPAGHPDLAESLNNLGALLNARGEYEKARGYFEQALGASRTSPTPLAFADPAPAAQILTPTPLTARIATNWAYLLWRQLSAQAGPASLRACADAHSLAAALHQRLRGEVLRDPDSKMQHGADAASLLPRQLDVLSRLARASGAAAPLWEAFTAVEQTRARVFLESLGEAHAAHLAGLPADLRDEEERLRDRLHGCDARLLTARTRPGTTPATLQQLWREQQAAEEALHQFSVRVAQSHPAYAGLRFPTPCTLEQARAALADNEVAILFALDEKASWALVLQKRPRPDDRNDGIVIVKLPGSDVLGPAVRTLVDAEVLKSDSRCRELGASLYDLLLRPLEPYTRGQDLVLGPDGVLWELPFELLVAGRSAEADGQYVIETRQIRYTPSLTVLHLIGQWQRQRTAPTEPLWALADPVFNKDDDRAHGDLPAQTRELLERYALRGSSPAGWRRLPATKREVAAIARLFPVSKDDVILDTSASEAVVKTASEKGILARKRYVHLATHGILGSGRERPPSLVLSLVGNDGAEQLGGFNDGFLTMAEVTHLKLNADLVVLSACETARGDLKAGEGVVGLSRAFLHAGSRGVVCSLWSVDDDRTATLMQALYEQLKGGESSAQALALARRQLIAQEEPPFYWAPFILIGQ